MILVRAFFFFILHHCYLSASCEQWIFFWQILSHFWQEIGNFLEIFFHRVNSTNFYNMLGKNCQFFKITPPPTPKTKQKPKKNPACEGWVCMHLCKTNIYNYLLKEIWISIICCLGQEGALNSCFGIHVCMSNFTLVKLITKHPPSPLPHFPNKYKLFAHTPRLQH